MRNREFSLDLLTYSHLVGNVPAGVGEDTMACILDDVGPVIAFRYWLGDI